MFHGWTLLKLSLLLVNGYLCEYMCCCVKESKLGSFFFTKNYFLVMTTTVYRGWQLQLLTPLLVLPFLWSTLMSLSLFFLYLCNFINCFVLFKFEVFFYCILIVKFDSMRSSFDCDVFIFIFEIMNKPFYPSIYIYLSIY